MDLGWIRECGASFEFELSLHAEQERLNDNLAYSDIAATLAVAELLESYPDTGRGASCLLLGFTGGQAVHCVAGLRRGPRLVIITVYLPKMPKWKNERERNKPLDLAP